MPKIEVWKCANCGKLVEGGKRDCNNFDFTSNHNVPVTFVTDYVNILDALHEIDVFHSNLLSLLNNEYEARKKAIYQAAK